MLNVLKLIFRFYVPTSLLGGIVLFSIFAAAPTMEHHEITVECKSVVQTDEVDEDGLRTFICKKA